jgi:hypothetical protein
MVSTKKKSEDHPEQVNPDSLASTITKALASLLQRYDEDTKHWQGKKMPESVKNDRGLKRSLINRLKSGQW